MTLDKVPETGSSPVRGLTGTEIGALVTRIFGWTTLTVLVAFLFNDFLTYWRGWPGVTRLVGGAPDVRAWFQAGLYGAAVLMVLLYVSWRRQRSLAVERDLVFTINSFLIRAAFWAVLLIGAVDFGLAFLRGEGLLTAALGDALSGRVIRAEFRGAYIHMSLVAVSVAIAAFTRSIGISWLALLIVVAELLMVIFRFIFSYEQDYMADLVRFWYAALFMLGCAYTLRQDGHVRIDVAYADFTSKGKSLVNALGTLLLGMPFCWLILIVGLSGRTGILNSALLTYEIEGLGNGLYVFYLMTVFMGMFAVSMLVEFVALLFGAVADYLDAPAKGGHDRSPIQPLPGQ